MNDRQRQLSFAKITPDWFSERRLLAGEIEQIIDDLKRHSDVQAVFPERLLLIERDGRQHAANPGAPCEQIGCLSLDDVEMFLFRDVDDALLRELVDLTFDN